MGGQIDMLAMTPAAHERYGVVQRTAHGKKWKIECQPHVRSRLKRVFPRAPQEAAEFLYISDTPENCRDILWFLERYPMVVDASDAAALADGAARHREQEKQVAAMFAEGFVPKPIELARPPREYQVFAARMLDTVDGLLLADDVGLGKTVTTICSLVDPACRPALVVAPTHLPTQWQEMIGEFAPGLTTHVVPSTKVAIPKLYRQGGQWVEAETPLPDVLLINYHKLRQWAESLAGAVKFVGFDEAQALHSPKSQIYAAAKLVAHAADKRVGLTASPIHNYGAEFFWVLDVLRPGALGERDEFIREWCNPGGNQDKARLKNPDEFGGYLRREGLMLRRTRVDVGRELPELVKVVHTVESDEKALRELKSNAAALARIILASHENEKGEKMRAAGEFDAMMRQATGIAKAPYVAQFVKLLLESEERVVLFGWHRNVYDIWLDELKDYNPALYTGTESPAEKDAAKQRFIKGESRVLIISLRSGAGIDGLQGHCRVVVFGELDWSPAIHLQGIGRVHRDGQEQECIAYYLVAEDGADPIMIDVLGVKKEQSEGVMNPGHALVERVDIGENNIKRLAREFLTKRGESFKANEAEILAGPWARPAQDD